MRNFRLVALYLLLTGLLLLACAPKAAPVAAPAPSAPTPQAAPAAPAAPARAAWEEEWEKWVEGAKGEGRLVIYSSAGSTVRTAVSQAFKRKFGIDVEAVTGKGTEVAEKLMSERRVGLYLVDVWVGGSSDPLAVLKPRGALDPLKPVLILPEVLDPSAWRYGGLRWLDSEECLSLAVATHVAAGLMVNTELVKPGEIKGYLDLLNPKWKGKIILNDPTKAGTGAKQFGVVGDQILNWDYWRAMVKQEPAIITDQRLMVEWVARGKYAVLIGPKPEIFEEFRKAGAPLDRVSPVEGSYITSGSGSLYLINRAPHPNAARVFVNWLPTKEGCTVLSRALGVPSARLDVPTEGFDPVATVQPGVKYFVSDDEKFQFAQAEHYQLAKEIFAPLLKK